MLHDASNGPPLAPAAAGITIRILGEFAVVADGKPVAQAAWRRTHARRLVQYLGSSARGSETRKKLLAALWPDFDEPRARNRLHHTLHGLRKAFEELPPATRPQVFVRDERVDLVLPRGVRLDWLELTGLMEADESDAAARLKALDCALERHGGDLAPCWNGQPEIDARRAWLAQRRDRALEEAVELARELGDDDSAIRFARQRARFRPDDLTAQGAYAMLLRDCGRAEAALLHCMHLRSRIERDDAEALPEVDEIIRLIQQRNNQATAAPVQPSLAPLLVSRHALASPRVPMRGYGALVSASGRLLHDAYTSILTLVGPPGAGKSLLASHVAYQAQSAFRHGAVMVNAGHCADASALCQALGLALAHPVGQAAATPAALHAALGGKDLLILVDDLTAQPGLVEVLQQLSLRHAELKWLVTTRLPLALRCERTLRVDPALLLEAEDRGAPTPAAQILAARLPRIAPTVGASAWAVLEQLARLCDGLPRALELAADRLDTMAPTELVERLHADPAALLRQPGAGGDARCRLARDVDDWLAAATPRELSVLSVLAACQGWLAREDLQCLHGGSADELDAFIELATRRNHLCRRVLNTECGLRSEFRVPRLLLAAPALARSTSAGDDTAERIAAWIERGPGRSLLGLASRAAWFDQRRCDVAAVVQRWSAQAEHARLQTFCVAHLPDWSLTQHPLAVLGWLDAALEHADDRAAQARLLLARAKLRLRLQQAVAACDDARCALRRLDADTGTDAALRQEALSLLQRHGSDSDASPVATDAIGSRGIEAAEALMRVAQLAVQHGRYGHALVVCEKSVDLFARFGVAHGQARAYRFLARIALAAGQLPRVEQSLDAAWSVMPPATRGADAARVELFRAELELNRTQLSAALARVNAVLAQPELASQDLTAARGLQIAAWVHFAQGTLPLALGLCREGHRLALSGAHAGMLSNAHVLEALISARLGRHDAALRHIGAAIERVDGDRPAADLQFELVNAAELAALFGRAALAQRLLAALHAFGNAAQQSLRPWIEQRAQALRQSLGEQPGAAGPDETNRLRPDDALRELMLA